MEIQYDLANEIADALNLPPNTTDFSLSFDWREGVFRVNAGLVYPEVPEGMTDLVRELRHYVLHPLSVERDSSCASSQ